MLLIHDHIRADALERGLSAMAADERVRIVPIQEAAQSKYGCSSDALGAMLAVESGDATLGLGRGGVIANRPALGAAPAVGVVASRRR